MKSKRKIITAFLIAILIVFIIVVLVNNNNKRADVKIPVLLYHNFVTTVPESDVDNFNYINTPESFEENIKIFLENSCKKN